MSATLAQRPDAQPLHCCLVSWTQMGVRGRWRDVLGKPDNGAAAYRMRFGPGLRGDRSVALGLPLYAVYLCLSFPILSWIHFSLVWFNGTYVVQLVVTRQERRREEGSRLDITVYLYMTKLFSCTSCFAILFLRRIRLPTLLCPHGLQTNIGRRTIHDNRP